MQSVSGLGAVTGPDGPPIASGAVVADAHAATLLALGIAGALYERTRTGSGQEVEVTMLQASLDIQAEGYALHLNGAKLKRPRNGLATTYHEAPYGYYQVTDGYVALSINPIAKISEALGGPAELDPYLDPAIAFSRRVVPEACSSLRALAKTRAQGRPGAGWHPQVRARQKCTRGGPQVRRIARPSLREWF